MELFNLLIIPSSLQLATVVLSEMNGNEPLYSVCAVASEEKITLSIQRNDTFNTEKRHFHGTNRAWIGASSR